MFLRMFRPHVGKSGKNLAGRMPSVRTLVAVVLIATLTASVAVNILPAPAAEASSSSTTLYAVADGYAWSGGTENPSGADSTCEKLRVGFRTAAGNYRTMIKFDLSEIPAGATITNADLKLYYYAYSSGSEGNPLDISVYRTTADWYEGGLSWSKAENYNSYSYDTVTIIAGSGAGYKTWDITSLVQNWVDGTYNDYGVLLRAPTQSGSSNFRSFRSKEYGSNVPRLEVTYTPSAPTLSFTNLTPSTITTSDSTYDATLSATGTNFNNVNRVTFTWSGPDSGTDIWDKGGSEWNSKVTVNSDTSMTLRPRVLSNETQSGTWTWTVTLRDISGATASQSFKVTYKPTLSFTNLTPSTITTSESTYDATLSATGTNFNNVNRVTFTWSGPDSGTDIWDKGGSDWNSKVTVNSDTSMTLRPRVLSNETQSGTWTWTVTLRDISGATASQYFTVAYTPPPPPTAPTLTDVVGTSNSVLLGWTDNSNNEDGFKVERKEGTSGTYTQIGTTGANVNVYADSGLQFGKVYCYRVRAYNSAGNSGYSSQKCATTLSTPILSSPSNGATLNTNTVTLTWNSVAGANGYAIKVSKISCGGGDIFDGASISCQQQISNLANGVYYWQVQAAATTYPGLSEYSACRYFTITISPSDTTDPNISITSPYNGQTFTTSAITVSGTASDNVGISKVEVKVGAGSWQLASGTISWSKQVTLSPGSNTIYARATDTSGRTKQTSVTVAYSPAEVGRVILIEPLEITPAGPYFVGDNLTATFRVKNVGNAAITLDKLLLGGRYNGGELPGGYPDFTYQTVTLQPGQSPQYQGTFTIPEPGTYDFFVAYYIENPTEAEKEFLDENNWNTCIELGEGLTDADRTRQITAEAIPPIQVIRWEVTNLYETSLLREFFGRVLDQVGDTMWCYVDVYVTGGELIKEVKIKLSNGEFINLHKQDPGHYRAELRLRSNLDPKKVLINIIDAIVTIYGGGASFSFPIGRTELLDASIVGISIVDTDEQIRYTTQSKEGQSLPERLPTFEDAMYIMLPGPWSTQEGTLYGRFSPVDLLVVDSDGRRVGALYEGGVFIDEVNEIPNALYWGRELDFQFIFVPDSSGGGPIYVVGTEAGDYVLTALSFNEGKTDAFAAVDIPTASGGVHQYTTDWDALSRGEEGVTVHVDSDGDGVFEDKFTSDAELTQDEFISHLQGCFIATAAYGTPMAEEIQILREFRDEYLLTNPLGQALVDFYYKVSPPMAEFITEHPSLKPIVRTGLLPAVVISTVVVNTTPAEKTAIAGLLVLVSVALAAWATRRRGRGPEYTWG